MKKILLPVSFLVLSLSSCTDEAEKAATELCDCFSAKVKKPSSDFKKLMKKVAQADVPSVTFKKEFAKFDEDEQAKLKVEIDRLIETDDATVRSCTKKVADFKIRGNSEEERTKKVVDIMSKKEGCEVGSAQWAMAVEQTFKNAKKKNTDTADEETEDKPRKKKKTTDDDVVEEEQ